jgi:glyoxylase-like metal-dependent hydrolase (beta-lactamase superfamily II)
LVLSHWHLDHIAGIPSYQAGPVIALEDTRNALLQNKAQIEAGTLWGPPAVHVVLPNITFSNRVDIYLGDRRIEFHHFNIHSKDGNLMYIPSDGVLFAGDALEDPITFMVEPEEVPRHIDELDRLRGMAIDRIYPNHGSLDAIKAGGYTKSFIDTTREYASNLLDCVLTPEFHNMSIEQSIPNGLAKGAVSIWEPYRSVHDLNLKLMYDCYAGSV